MPVTISWIEKQSNRCGGDACIRDTRIPVWVLINYHRLGSADADILKWYPNLSASDIEVAMEYADHHPDEINQAIRENEQGEAGFVE